MDQQPRLRAELPHSDGVGLRLAVGIKRHVLIAEALAKLRWGSDVVVALGLTTFGGLPPKVYKHDAVSNIFVH